MQEKRKERNDRWGVVLAGGDGTRLRSVTRILTGDDRPKQFCPIMNGKTLLAHTRRRVARVIPSERTLFVLSREHERFYTQELAQTALTHMLVQPTNRGTLPAILYAALRVAHLDRDATVAFFPSDHHYQQERKFLAGVEFAFEAAEDHPDKVILIAASASGPETGVGWIETHTLPVAGSRSTILGVKRFWEKPAPGVARELLSRGCVWNTFVMVGKVRAFLDLIQSQEPALFEACRNLGPVQEPESEQSALDAAYAQILGGDFSRGVLTTAPHKLGVFCVGDVGWSDLGEPHRLLATMRASGLDHGWTSELGGDEAAIASVA
jgi:mannose-1-phosphate guanylyltransferase